MGTEITEVTLGHVAWFEDNSDKKTHPVGQKEPNAFGLYDMQGNVWEMCLDAMTSTVGNESNGAEEIEPVGAYKPANCDARHLIRGGCFADVAWGVRVGRRLSINNSSTAASANLDPALDGAITAAANTGVRFACPAVIPITNAEAEGGEEEDTTPTEGGNE